MDKLDNATYLLNDLIQGDEEVSLREDFNDLTGQDVQEALKLIVNNPLLSDNEKKYLILNSWRIHYRIKPPTVEEFLTTEWIGPTALNIFGHVKKVLGEFWSPLSSYRHLLLASHFRWGKSLASAISALYVAVHLWAMRSPKKFFGKGEATTFVQALISFNLDKAKQVLLQPFYQILISSPKFKRVRTEEKINVRQEEFPNNIVWTSAGKVGSLQFFNNIHITIASNPAHLLGLTLITAVLSEISFFIERGVSPEAIWRIYNDAKTRINGSFGKRYFATTIIDSSPNDMELSPIDKYIFSGRAEKDPLNYVVTGNHWTSFPEQYPKWKKTKKTFPVFRGSGSKDAKLLNFGELKNYIKTEIINVPVDLHQYFKDNLTKAIKDYAGWPSGSQSKLITEFSIIENMFSPQLNNIYSYIYAPADARPEGLIWNQIKDKFFIEVSPGHYEFYRSPKEQRFIHVDQSESGDMASITMVHPEIDRFGDIIQITDFTIVISPAKKRKVNFDSIICFIEDLRKKGGILLKRRKVKNKDGKLINKDFGKITFDRFESGPARQRLERKGFPVDRLSVEGINPYLTLVSWMSNRRVKCGKNVILKNNLKSLVEIRTDKGRKKIDHLKGQAVLEDGGDWEMSLMGINAKDCSDTLCGAVWNSIQWFEGIPKYQWKQDNLQLEREVSGEGKKAVSEKEKQAILEEINKRFGLVMTKSI